jgi:hypothetical protein
MMLESPRNGRRVLAFLALMAASLVGLLLLPPISQDQNYHDFADQRTILGIPHFWNVVSNLPFILIGVAGMRRSHRDPAIFVLFLAILMTGFGSFYYHLDPNDRTLFWDRLPMSIGFMAILALAIEERLDAKAGAILLWPLIAIGVFSLLLWRWNGDLRLYGWVQFCRCDFKWPYVETSCCGRSLLHGAQLFPAATPDPNTSGAQHRESQVSVASAYAGMVKEVFKYLPSEAASRRSTC